MKIITTILILLFLSFGLKAQTFINNTTQSDTNAIVTFKGGLNSDLMFQIKRDWVDTSNTFGNKARSYMGSIIRTGNILWVRGSSNGNTTPNIWYQLATGTIPSTFNAIQGYGLLLTGTYPNITFTVDTTSGYLATWALLKKKTDSLGNILVHYTDTASMLSGYARIGSLADSNFWRNVSSNTITTKGAVQNLSLTGSVTAASFSASGTITAQNAVVNNQLNASNISAGTVAGTLQTAAQPLITSLGTLSSLTVNGAVTITVTNSILYSNGTGTLTGVTIGSGLTFTGGSLSNTSPSIGGTVTTVSIVNANGISGTVTNPTTTPAITLTLGNITPTSVLASGAITASYFSGIGTALTGVVKYTDTASMLSNLLRKTDTLTMLSNYPTTAGYGLLKSSKVLSADTTFGYLATNALLKKKIDSLAGVSGTEYWQKSTNTLSPLTSTDVVAVNVSSGLTALGGTSNSGIGVLGTSTSSVGVQGASTTAQGVIASNNSSTTEALRVVNIGSGNIAIFQNNTSTVTAITNLGTITTTGNIQAASITSTGGINGTLTTVSQPNITTVGTLGALTVTNSITATNLYGIFNGTATNVSNPLFVGASLAYASGASYNGSASRTINTIQDIQTTANVQFASLTTANWITSPIFYGTIGTAAQPNITSIGTLTGLTISGNTNSVGQILITKDGEYNRNQAASANASQYNTILNSAGTKRFEQGFLATSSDTYTIRNNTSIGSIIIATNNTNAIVIDQNQNVNVTGIIQAAGLTLSGGLSVAGLLTANGGYSSTINAATTLLPFFIDDGTYGMYLYGQNTLNFNWGHNATSPFEFNYFGYHNLLTQFRDIGFNDGKGNRVFGYVGSTKAITFAGTITAASDIKLSTVGSGIYVKEGTNATMGTGTLVGGTVVISTTKVTANSRIFITDNGGGVVANIGALYISARSAGTSFTVSSSNVLDTSNFSWIIIEPS